MKSKKSKFIFRPAIISDISGLLELEKSAWGENGASRNQLISRIETFSNGNIIAIYDQKIVGYLSFEYVDNVAKLPHFSWDEISDNGFMTKSHRPNGNYMYGVNLSVHKSMSGQQLGFGLTLQAWAEMILTNKLGVFMGSRMPGYRNYKKHNPEITAEEYVKLKRNGKTRDPELRMYEKDGFCIVKVLPNYFPDPQSENYGVLLYRKNPFYNWPFRKLWIWLIARIPIKYRENISIADVQKIQEK